MGQRLVISINKGDTELANAYYHWSGFADKAVNLTKDILKALKENDNIKAEKNDVIKAIMLLEATGASLIDEDSVKYYNDHLKAINPNITIGATDNTSGTIAITKASMKNNIDWAESRVIIDLDKEEIVFAVFYKAIAGRFQYIWNRKDRYNETDIKAGKNYTETMANAPRLNHNDFKRWDLLQTHRQHNGTFHSPFVGIKFKFDKLEELSQAITQSIVVSNKYMVLDDSNGDEDRLAYCTILHCIY